MIKFKCPHCGKGMTAGDESAGKKGRCPGCKEVFVIPGAGAVKAAPAAERRTLPPAAEDEDEAPRKKRPARDEEDEDEAIAEAPRRRRPARNDEDEDEPRPRKKRGRDEDDEDDRPRRKRRKGKKGPYADCPNCGCRGDATRVYWTFGWDILPTFFRTVRCNRCGTEYNGKHGDYNTKRYFIYLAIVVPIAIVLGIISAILENK